MQNKFKEIKEEYAKLQAELSQPEIAKNPQRLAELGRRQSELEEIIFSVTRLEKIEQEMQGNLEIMNSADQEMSALAIEENVQLAKEKESLTKQLETALTPQDPNDKKNVIVEIRAGAGGDEAGLFAGDLFRMYSHYAESFGWKIHLISSSTSGIGGYKEIIFSITGQNVYGKMKFESGVHRVQRVPETEKMGRVHTSTATVAVLPEVEDVEIEIKPEDLRIDTFASSGPGGQSVNTTNSAVRILHVPTNTIVSCQDQKSQLQNREQAMKVLRARLYSLREEEEQKKRSETRHNQIGTGDRSEKIRTYNFPQDRITDHRIKQSWSNLEEILNGDLAKIIETLKEEADKKASAN
ncbi:MAG TPA: peptide chain release factor 1 [Candidatus Moranbacteria bacterium]|nr:peptide chain release factor 1 [Candidatus Moranbacteria bacterium]